jgi:hypothetical protein
VLEQHPELLAGGLVPFREEFLNYTMEFEVLSPNQGNHLAAAHSERNEKVFPKVQAI